MQYRTLKTSKLEGKNVKLKGSTSYPSRLSLVLMYLCDVKIKILSFTILRQVCTRFSIFLVFDLHICLLIEILADSDMIIILPFLRVHLSHQKDPRNTGTMTTAFSHVT